jgi:RES domain-containing protein
MAARAAAVAVRPSVRQAPREKSGDRFNPQGPPAIYTIRRVQIACLEARRAFPFKAQPLTLCAYEVGCANVADLTDPSKPAPLRVRPTTLACPCEDLASRKQTPPSRGLTQRLQTDGIAAIIVPSFAPGAIRWDADISLWRRRRTRRMACRSMTRKAGSHGTIDLGKRSGSSRPARLLISPASRD